MTVTDWPTAWHRALYGPDGFYRRTGPDGAPAAHFRTAVHAAPDALADALLELVRRLGGTAVVDVGAGRGELLTAIAARAGGSFDGSLPRLHAVDLVPRPPGLAPSIGWSPGWDHLPDDALRGAVLIAWELLDTAPVAVLEVDDDGITRQVLVDPDDGSEELGEPASAAQLAWCDRWWPLDGAGPGTRAEVGESRDTFWGNLVRRASQAGAVAALAVDYSHHRASRPPCGSLAGYRAGRLVPAVPDGSCDITAHVALDAVAAAGLANGATASELRTQREALRELGLATGTARTDPASEGLTGGWLERRGAVAELLDPGGLGGFGWLLQRLG